MVRTLSKDAQNYIKNFLLNFGYSYSEIIKRISRVQNSTILDYNRKVFWNRTPSPSGQQTLINATSRIIFSKRLN